MEGLHILDPVLGSVVVLFYGRALALLYSVPRKPKVQGFTVFSIPMDLEVSMWKMVLAVWILAIVVILVFMWSSQRKGEERESKSSN